jgi:DNA polymerase (family 10)
VADALREIGALLSLEKGNRFRARAYDRAASVVVAAPDLETLVRERMLTSLPGIGPSLAGVVTELVRTGRSAMLERLRRECPPGTAELSRVLSLPRIRALYRSLGTTSLASLRAACRAGLVRNVPGFGERASTICWNGSMRSRRDRSTCSFPRR